MPVSFDFSGAESLVNSTTTGFQGNPQVAALAGGGYVIVWNDESGLGGDTSGSSVRAQLYTDDGTRLGGEFLVNQATDGNQSLASVIALADAGFAVGWTSSDLGYTTADGLARVFTAAGAPLGDEFALPAAAPGQQIGPILAAFDDGGFVAVWTDYGPSGATTDGTLRGQVFTTDGAANGAAFEIAGYTSGSQYLPAVAVLADGRFVVSWTDYLTVPDGSRELYGSVQARVFAANGAPEGDAFAAADLGGGQSNSTVAALDGGGFAIGWGDFSHANDYDIRVRMFDPAGEATGASFAINLTTDVRHQSPQLLSWPGGGFMAAWWDFAATGGETDSWIAARTFSEQGVPTSGEQRLNALLPGHQAAPSLAVLADGTMVAAWEEYSSAYDGSGPAVFARRFTVSADVAGAGEVFGTVGDDHLVALPDGAILWGYSGNDSLDGGLGSDIFDGGSGDDTLNGGPGGEDMVEGGTGRDRLVVDWSDSTSDVVTELSTDGSGRFVDGTGRSVAFHGVEYIDIATGAGNDLVLLGGDGIARTGAGNDVVIAYFGAVRVSGGAGDDHFISDGVGDTFNGGAGNDTADYRSATAGVTVALALIAGATGSGPGGTALSNVENVNGSQYGDRLSGNDEANVLGGFAGNDRLVGNGGGDRLSGDAGNDRMYGGTGDDEFWVHDAGDRVYEAEGEGFDVVTAFVSYRLAAGQHVERLYIIGDSAMSLTGNELDNHLIGSVGPTVLDGGGGDDLLDGATGDDRLVGGNGEDRLLGARGDDVLRGGSGRDRLIGEDGADLLDGGVGKDTLTGEAGRDVFQFRDGDMGSNRALADVITDFSKTDHEKIQLNLVDADTTLAGNQAFAWIGNGAFSGVAGQLRYALQGGSTYVEGDTDGDGSADFAIALNGAINLSAGDFVL